jgi:5-methylcytosine-specific restriction protein A
LDRRRQRLFAEQPLCVVCLTIGIVERATIRDHIVPLAEGGADTEANTQPLCANCHRQKTQAEQTRGLRRFHQNKP